MYQRRRTKIVKRSNKKSFRKPLRRSNRKSLRKPLRRSNRKSLRKRQVNQKNVKKNLRQKGGAGNMESLLDLGQEINEKLDILDKFCFGSHPHSSGQLTAASSGPEPLERDVSESEAAAGATSPAGRLQRAVSTASSVGAFQQATAQPNEPLERDVSESEAAAGVPRESTSPRESSSSEVRASQAETEADRHARRQRERQASDSAAERRRQARHAELAEWQGVAAEARQDQPPADEEARQQELLEAAVAGALMVERQRSSSNASAAEAGVGE